jgi:hypothetical protein
VQGPTCILWANLTPFSLKDRPACAEALARAGCDIGIRDIDDMTGRQVFIQLSETSLVM